MGNQQATPTEAELAWLAGIVEGEGTLSLAPQSTGKKNANSEDHLKIAIHIRIYNTDGGIIAKVVEIMERMGVSPHVNERDQQPLQMAGRPGPGYMTRDSLFTVKVQKMRPALQFLEAVRPWLFGDKAKRADLMLKFVRRRLGIVEDAGHQGQQGAYRPPYDATDWRVMQEFLALGGRSTKGVIVERVLNEFEQRMPISA